MRRVLAFFALALALGVACGPGDQIDRLVVENESGYPLQMEVSDAEGETWLPVGVVPPDAEKIVRRVADRGETWVFRFSYGGTEAGRLRLSRRELVEAEWHVQAPEVFGEELQEQGAGLPPEEAVR